MHRWLVIAILLASANSHGYAQIAADTVKIRWDSIIAVSKTTATLQLVENPLVRNSSPIHQVVFKALKDLGADYVRYVPWFPYPKMAVAELMPPSAGKTYWDFTYLDSTIEAVMEATKGHPVVINFSTTPAWMWSTGTKVSYPEDAYQTAWNYNMGRQLRDTTMKELAGYFSSLFSWYTKGGFTDELGKFHKSNHYYNIPYWEVLNEPDLEHEISPELYTRMYDAIVGELKKLSPQTKFVGLSLAKIRNPAYFEYFLNPKNHKPGVPLEGISYHHYSTPSFSDQSLQVYQYIFFEKADAFLDKVRYIEYIRKRLAPQTFTMINEIGVILRYPTESGPIDDQYWNAAGALYAYIFLELTKIGIDVAGESQLVGYPTQFPDVSMVNWNTGKPNARYWVLKLIKDHFGPGDKLADTWFTQNVAIGQPPSVHTQGIITRKGKRIFLINKENKETQVVLPQEARGAIIHYVDNDTKENPPAESMVNGDRITLKPFAVAVVEIK
jgi:hypothetical protein